MKGYIWITAAAVVLVVMVLINLRCTLFPGIFDCEDNGDGNPTSTPTPTPPRETIILISMASSSTKKQWVDQAVETFNALSKTEGRLQLDGKPIEVEIILEETSPGKWDHYRSGSMITDILDDKIKPTIASPAQKSWILKLNREWQLLYGKPITTGTGR